MKFRSERQLHHRPGPLPHARQKVRQSQRRLKVFRSIFNYLLVLLHHSPTSLLPLHHISLLPPSFSFQQARLLHLSFLISQPSLFYYCPLSHLSQPSRCQIEKTSVLSAGTSDLDSLLSTTSTSRHPCLYFVSSPCWTLDQLNPISSASFPHALTGPETPKATSPTSNPREPWALSPAPYQQSFAGHPTTRNMDQQTHNGVSGPAGRRLHIAHRRSPSEMTPMISEWLCGTLTW